MEGDRVAQLIARFVASQENKIADLEQGSWFGLLSYQLSVRQYIYLFIYLRLN